MASYQKGELSDKNDFPYVQVVAGFDVVFQILIIFTGTSYRIFCMWRVSPDFWCVADVLFDLAHDLQCFCLVQFNG